jgi:hypothetical protein
LRSQLPIERELPEEGGREKKVRRVREGGGGRECM